MPSGKDKRPLVSSRAKTGDRPRAKPDNQVVEDKGKVDKRKNEDLCGAGKE